MNWEDTILFRGQNLESLLQAESQEQDAGEYEQSNDSARAPRVQNTAEIDGKYSAYVSPCRRWWVSTKDKYVVSEGTTYRRSKRFRHSQDPEVVF